MLVTPFALVMPGIGIDRCGPLMTVVVPWDILQASSKLLQWRWNVRRVVLQPVTIPRRSSPILGGRRWKQTMLADVKS